MCAIIGSFNKKRFAELYSLNEYRGSLSYSVSTFHTDGEKAKLGLHFKDKGKIPDELINNLPHEDTHYIVGHSQAPTQETNNIHPAVYGDAMLWHNGIIKQKHVPNNTWDTSWLLEKIIDYGWSSLSRIDGTFACVMFWGNKLYCFRNEISPLFIDDNYNLSSTQFNNSRSIPPNIVWHVNFESMLLTNAAYFETFENPYFMPE